MLSETIRVKGNGRLLIENKIKENQNTYAVKIIGALAAMVMQNY